MHPRARSFRERSRAEIGFDPDIHELPAGTRTAADASDAIGCHIGQIVKSMVMAADDELVLVLTGGPNRIVESALADVCSVGVDTIDTASPDAVKDATGWSIGGVPPFAHDSHLETFIDPSLLEYDEVWAGAGTPSAVFPIDPTDLVAITDAESIDAFTGE